MKITTYTTFEVTFKNGAKGEDGEIEYRDKEIMRYEYENNSQVRQLFDDAVRFFKRQVDYYEIMYGVRNDYYIYKNGNDIVSCFVHADNYDLFFNVRMTIR